MAKKAKDYPKLASDIVGKIGGKGNVQSLTHCVTRLRFVLKDEDVARTDEIKELEGVVDVMKSGGQYQVVIGTDVEKAYDAVMPLLNLQNEESDAEQKGEKKNSILDIISSIFTPIMGAMAASGIIKGLLIMLPILGVLDEKSDLYIIMYAAGDAFFYFMPLALAVTTARKFNCNQFVALSLGAALLYPDLITALGGEGGLHFLGIPVINVSYASSVIPIVAAVWLLSYLEKWLKKVIPSLVANIFIPGICLLIMVPVTLVAVGPAMSLLGQALASAYMFIYGICPPLAGGLVAGLWPLIVVIGGHWAFFPIAMNNFATLGYDTLLPVTTGTNFAIAGATLAVGLKTKKGSLKQLGLSTAFSALIGGVTEPAIYGIVLKYKRTLYVCMASIAVGGVVAGIAGSQVTAVLTTCILTLPAMAAFVGGWGFVAAAIIGFIGAFVGTWLFGFNDSMIQE